MRRLLLFIAGALILMAVAVPTATVYYLAYTQSGFQFIVSRIPHKAAGVTLDVIKASGTVAHGIRVEQLDIDHHLVHLTIRNIQARVELLPLLLQTIRTKGASIESVTVEIKRRKKPPIPSTPFFLPHWLVVSGEHSRIVQVHVVDYEGVL